MEPASVLSDVACHLGEGPTYDPATSTLFWFDILERRLLETSIAGGPTIIHELPIMASALAVIDEGRDLLACEDGLHVRERATGRMSLHVRIETGATTTRSNDCRVHPSGALWVGTMGRNAEPRAGSIYWYRDGETRLLFPGISIPNSICFSPAGEIAYFADTATGIVHRVALDPETGLPIGEPKTFLDHRGKGSPDGSVTDRDGLLWNARFGAGSLDAYAPDGRRVQSITMPARQVTCPAFAGADFGAMVVTSAWEHLDEKARERDPMAGMTFVIPSGFRGKPEPRVLL